MKRKKEEYMSDAARVLAEQLDKQLKEDQELEFARNAIERIPEHRREYVFKLLSLQYAAKGATGVNENKSITN